MNDKLNDTAKADKTCNCWAIRSGLCSAKPKNWEVLEPSEALEGGPIRPWWMYPFEKRYMKKLKGYVRNKAKPEGSIAELLCARRALTFCSHYFWDVTTKFNRPDRNVDPSSLNVSVSSVSIGIPEIDTYRSQFKSLFPNKDMQEEFPDWFGSQIRQRHVDNDQDPEVSTTSELFALANGDLHGSISIIKLLRSRRCELQEIIEFKYLLFKVALFRVKWFDTSNKGRKVNKLVLRNNMTQIDCSREAFKDDQYILVNKSNRSSNLKIRPKTHWEGRRTCLSKKFSDGVSIVVEEILIIIHFDKIIVISPLFYCLNDLNNATLHIDGQSTVVDAPPDIIDVPDEDDDIIGDEDASLMI
ncbi:hypothetical protein Tco_0269705 [Tanacetum coccineum]